MKTEPNKSITPHAFGLSKPEFGLTKREYFAAMAMQGLLANPNVPAKYVVNDAVSYADDLITVLNNQP